MMKLLFDHSPKLPLKILCLGAHSDDIEIGCGATILRLTESMPCEIIWVVFSADSVREAEAKECARLFLKAGTSSRIVIKNFRNGFFPYTAVEIKEYFEELKNDFNPDVIFTHYRNDLHQDHRLISELTCNTYRSHWILEYEVPKYDGDMGTPNLFVPVDDEICRRKTDYIVKCFVSQKDKHWFSADTFTSILRLRGIESGHHYAESFYCRKSLL
jgi:LmbE family N-acetylglucosaminyl deacetylase